MKIKAKINYYDTFEGRDIKENEIYETTEERAKLIESRNYGEIIIEDKETNNGVLKKEKKRKDRKAK